tara:strand:- start:48907 stop:49593 length:687 start_codon:yes stop_codon:yes gene_type:complete
MINQKYTRLFNTEHRPVETGVIIPDEGIALVYTKEGDKTVVRPSTGAAGEHFAGLSLSRNAPPLFMPYIEEASVEGEFLELPRTPIAGQILVKIGGTKVTINAGTDAPADASSVSLDDNTIRFHADHDGEDLMVQMMYEPTITEARQWKGDMPVGGLPSSAQGIIGVITKGDASTTYFDASADWSGAIKAKLGPDGIFTTVGSGAQAEGVTVLQSPTPAVPLLVLNID